MLNAKALTLQAFVSGRVKRDATIYTDDHGADRKLPFRPEAATHSVSVYVRGQAHVYGIDVFWTLPKRWYQGTFHYLSAKQLARNVVEFAARYDIRDLDTLEQMAFVVRGMTASRLKYTDLIV